MDSNKRGFAHTLLIIMGMHYVATLSLCKLIATRVRRILQGLPQNFPIINGKCKVTLKKLTSSMYPIVLWYTINHKEKLLFTRLTPIFSLKSLERNAPRDAQIYTKLVICLYTY